MLIVKKKGTCYLSKENEHVSCQGKRVMLLMKGKHSCCQGNRCMLVVNGKHVKDKESY